MGRFVEGEDRRQDFLLPASLDDYVSEDNPVRDARQPTKRGFPSAASRTLETLMFRPIILQPNARQPKASALRCLHDPLRQTHPRARRRLYCPRVRTR